MKTKIFLIVISTLLCFYGYSQELKVSCTESTIYCDGDTNILIAEDVNVIGGVEPYKYTWTCELKIGNLVFGSSFFLDDTSTKQPRITEMYAGGDTTRLFKLKVEDANGNIVCDSVFVRFSNFVYGLGYSECTITIGDSVKLYKPDIRSARPIVSIHWDPTKWISDTNSFSPWCKPKERITYNAAFTDDIGCKSMYNTALVIHVRGVSNDLLKKQSTEIYQVKNYLHCELENISNSRLIIFNIGGQKVKEIISPKFPLDINSLSVPKGMYIYNLLHNNTSHTGKLIK